MVLGSQAPREVAENELKVPLSMGRKIIETPKENEGFCRSRGLSDSADSQNLSLEETSIWRKKIIEILSENEGFWRSMENELN